MKKHYTANQIIEFIYRKDGTFWSRQRERRALELFNKTSQGVPAYKDFLEKNSIDPDAVRTWADFQLVPRTSKKNYLRQYPLEELCWGGSLKSPIVFSATSGSTGKPFYFPRDAKIDWHQSIISELFLRNALAGKDEPTLVLVCFGMGVWIGGLINYQGFSYINERGFSLSILTPGVNIKEAMNALRELAPSYRNLILVGYPPFMKDIVDEALDEGIDLKKYHIRFLFAAEAFTENFREYLVSNVGGGNLYRDTMNIYGSADIGAMAFETPTSILVRRLALEHEDIFEALFSSIKKTPTLAQYNPLFITFEAPNGEILVTGDNTIPLIRYDIGDNGGVFSFSEVDAILKKGGINLEDEARKQGITLYQLPFVYVYERSDFSTTLYGLQVYPEFIKEAVLDPMAQKWLTGKFTMLTKYDSDQNQYLEINLELKRNQKEPSASEKVKVLEHIKQTLKKKSSEFRELSTHVNKRELIELVFWPAGDPLYFKSGIKQKWVQNEAKRG